MPFAGTPLGDPIEVGALGQALQGKAAAPRTIAMGSVKSVFGHTEGAAGLTGLLLAHLQLGTTGQPSVMHLRGMNPYVQATLQDWKKTHSAETVIQRQSSPAVSGSAAGCSSFGMSGINAHAILLPSDRTAGEQSQTQIAWRRVRCWPKPQAFALLLSVTAINGGAHFACGLQSARLAYLFGHKVRFCPFSLNFTFSHETDTESGFCGSEIVRPVRYVFT